MYFRMLKRDLTDKVGLNITLFVFMILASAFIVISTHLLYSSFVGSENTYEICNTSDITMIVQNSISDSKGQREEIEAFWALVATAEANTCVLTEPEAPYAVLMSYGDSAINYSLRYWVKGDDYWNSLFEINKNIKLAFDKAGIEMTYPHLNVHLDK